MCVCACVLQLGINTNLAHTSISVVSDAIYFERDDVTYLIGGGMVVR